METSQICVTGGVASQNQDLRQMLVLLVIWGWYFVKIALFESLPCFLITENAKPWLIYNWFSVSLILIGWLPWIICLIALISSLFSEAEGLPSVVNCRNSAIFKENQVTHIFCYTWTTHSMLLLQSTNNLCRFLPLWVWKMYHF